jgi:hypothetical protein
MAEAQKPDAHNKRIASHALASMAAYASKSTDQFSNWLAIGLGAMLSLIIGNIDKLAAYIDIEQIKIAVLFYVIILLIVIAQKRISLSVLGFNHGTELAREIIDSYGSEGLDFKFIREQVVAGSSDDKKVIRDLDEIEKSHESGDGMVAAVRHSRLSKFQYKLVFCQALLTISVILIIAFDIH